MGKQLAITNNGVFATGSKAFLTVGGVHHKVLKMFRTTEGVHRLCFSGGVDVATMSISYTGNMQDEIVTMSGVQYRLLTLTSSGTLTVDEEVNAEVWLCDGGNAGVVYDSGGGGGYIGSAALILPLSTVAIIGSGGRTSGDRGGKTSFGGATSNRPSGSGSFTDGASGGGQQWDRNRGTGQGKTTYPFGDQVYFKDRPHSAGGGGGGYLEVWCDGESFINYDGGWGGSNGSNGDYSSYYEGYDYSAGGTGGKYGGGDGGYAEFDGLYAYDGDPAYFYGGGGGGGSEIELYDQDGNNVDYYHGSGGAGYQGVIYIRIPIEQTA